MLKKYNDDGVDVYKGDGVEIHDLRTNRKTVPTVAVEVIDGKSQVVCLICNKKYGPEDGAIQEFMNHKCKQKGDKKLV